MISFKEIEIRKIDLNFYVIVSFFVFVIHLITKEFTTTTCTNLMMKSNFFVQNNFRPHHLVFQFLILISEEKFENLKISLIFRGHRFLFDVHFIFNFVDGQFFFNFAATNFHR